MNKLKKILKTTQETLQGEKGLLGFFTGVAEGAIASHIMPTISKPINNDNSTVNISKISGSFFAGALCGFLGPLMSYFPLSVKDDKPYFLIPIATNLASYIFETGIKIKNNYNKTEGENK
jgi:hypothetical protein